VCVDDLVFWYELERASVLGSVRLEDRVGVQLRFDVQRIRYRPPILHLLVIAQPSAGIALLEREGVFLGIWPLRIRQGDIEAPFFRRRAQSEFREAVVRITEVCTRVCRHALARVEQFERRFLKRGQAQRLALVGDLDRRIRPLCRRAELGDRRVALRLGLCDRAVVRASVHSARIRLAAAVASDDRAVRAIATPVLGNRRIGAGPWRTLAGQFVAAAEQQHRKHDSTHEPRTRGIDLTELHHSLRSVVLWAHPYKS